MNVMRNPYWRYSCLALLCGLLTASLRAEDHAAQREQVLALGKLTTPPSVAAAEGFASTDDLKAIYFDALPWQGKPTKVFAWLGVPKERQGKVPGIVLVHGGGGTAFKDWVVRWNAHGFAAISIAVEGQTDRRAPAATEGQRSGWQSHEWAGPARTGIYQDADKPLADQWMYHAVADTILANSLLRSLPGVDETQVGLMGISWGGVITSTVVGIDDRFAFAIPTYGCGHLADAENQYGRALGRNETYRQVWDPMLRLERAKMPILWFSWPEDQHFPMDCQAASYRAAPSPRMVVLVPEMGHGHSPPWLRPDSYSFAKSVLRYGKPWCQQTDSAFEDGVFSATITSPRPFEKAVLISTNDLGITGSRKWTQSPATLTQQGPNWIAKAELPTAATAWFINFYGEPLIVSSDFMVRSSD